mmetsp:Transcript_60428/g.97923  ORF Transcript_60428/g.97923 Transcript_60428/m.97923 type:complete len:81 (-) Transcript_60428:847-1089(-)
MLEIAPGPFFRSTPCPGVTPGNGKYNSMTSSGRMTPPPLTTTLSASRDSREHPRARSLDFRGVASGADEVDIVLMSWIVS